MIKGRSVLAVAILLLLATTSADAQRRGGGGFGGGGGGGGFGGGAGAKMCIPATKFQVCLQHCFDQMGGPGDAVDHNHCTKRCSNRLCPA